MGQAEIRCRLDRTEQLLTKADIGQIIPINEEYSLTIQEEEM